MRSNPGWSRFRSRWADRTLEAGAAPVTVRPLFGSGWCVGVRVMS
ncbi:MAG: hypothetical protein QOE97_3597 [Pseudonocardiales bacterium]|jgi:hypothetical protein|nr:hypothetical protein [Pseudonocardiales bacterium]